MRHRDDVGRRRDQHRGRYCRSFGHRQCGRRRIEGMSDHGGGHGPKRSIAAAILRRQVDQVATTRRAAAVTGLVERDDSVARGTSARMHPRQQPQRMVS